jgi:DNA-binding NarL/FixJ family response regulator
MARVLLYSAVPIVAKGFAAVLSSVPEFDLTSVCADVRQLPQAVVAAEPDLVVLDIDQEMSFERLFEMRRAMSSRVKIILWVHTIVPELAYQTMRLGVRGILRKTLGAEVMIRCLQQVNRGECWFEETLTSSFMNMKTVRLSRRESQLISLVSQGRKNKEIASALSIAEQTVKIYLSRVFRKVGVKDRLELALYGLRNMMTGQVDLAAGATGAITPTMPPLLAVEEDAPPRVGPRGVGLLSIRSA